jgi:hypothetical protein
LNRNRISVNDNLLKRANEYHYEADIENLKFVLKTLQGEIKVWGFLFTKHRDDLIYQQNCEKKQLELKIKELEQRMENVILSSVNKKNKLKY